MDSVGGGTAIIDRGTTTTIGGLHIMEVITLHTTLIDITPTTTTEEVQGHHMRILDRIQVELTEETTAITVDRTA